MLQASKQDPQELLAILIVFFCPKCISWPRVLCAAWKTRLMWLALCPKGPEHLMDSESLTSSLINLSPLQYNNIYRI